MANAKAAAKRHAKFPTTDGLLAVADVDDDDAPGALPFTIPDHAVFKNPGGAPDIMEWLWCIGVCNLVVGKRSSQLVMQGGRGGV